MTKKILIAIMLFLIPVITRYAWFYQGFYSAARSINSPDYSQYTIPTADISTAFPGTDIPSTSSNIKTILFDQTHLNNFKPSEIEPFLADLKTNNSRIVYTNYQDSFANQIKKADVFVLVSPTIAYTAEELSAIHNFINRGGRMLIVAEPTRKYPPVITFETTPSMINSVDILNIILDPYGIAIEDNYIYNQVENEGNYRNVIFSENKDDGITRGLEEIVFYSTHNIMTNQGCLVTGSDSMRTTGSLQGSSVCPAAGSSEEGLLVLGDFTLLTSPYNQVGDNPLFLNNIASFLKRGEIVTKLGDFPDVFSESISIVIPGEISVDKNMLGMISSIQSYMKYQGQKVELSRNTQSGKDMLFLTTYDQEDLLENVFRQFKLEWSGSVDELDPGTIKIPGIGSFAASEVSLFLFIPGSASNQLYIIADTYDTLKIPVGIFNSGSLSSCYVQDNLGVCPMDSANIFPEMNLEFKPEFGASEPYSTSEPTILITPVPTQGTQPTPSG